MPPGPCLNNRRFTYSDGLGDLDPRCSFDLSAGNRSLNFTQAVSNKAHGPERPGFHPRNRSKWSHERGPPRQPWQIMSLLVPRGGIEPPTHGFSVRCSTN
jgi:hypothetical protein